jgi:hypothetical protein
MDSTPGRRRPSSEDEERPMKSRCVRLASALCAAVSVLASAGVTQADVETATLRMDEFTPSFQPLTEDVYARHYPMALGGRSPTSPVRSWGGCTVLRLKRAEEIREITYLSTGDSGTSYVFLWEHRYAELDSLATDTRDYPGGAYEKTLLAQTDDPIPVRKGYRYVLCVEGAPGTAPGNFNQIDGFRILYRSRKR